MAYTLIRTKDGRTEELKTTGRQFNDGSWYPFGEYPKGCSFNFPLVFRNYQDAERRKNEEAEGDPSWNYEINNQYNR